MPDPYWASDVPISMPMPPTNPRRVPMGGFTMTDGGLAHDMNDDDYVRLSTPTFRPRDFGLQPVYEDADVDAPPSDVEVF